MPYILDGKRKVGYLTEAQCSVGKRFIVNATTIDSSRCGGEVAFTPFEAGRDQEVASHLTESIHPFGEYMFDLMIGDRTDEVVETVAGVIAQCARCVGCEGRNCDFDNNVYWKTDGGTDLKPLASRARPKVQK